MNSKQIINMRVYTQSNDYLGRIINIEIDTETFYITKYFIKTLNIIKNLFQNYLIINHTQVISILDNKMIVEDNIGKIKEPVSLPAR